MSAIVAPQIEAYLSVPRRGSRAHPGPDGSLRGRAGLPHRRAAGGQVPGDPGPPGLRPGASWSWAPGSATPPGGSPAACSPEAKSTAPTWRRTTASGRWTGWAARGSRGGSLHVGEALEIARGLDGPFDIVFNDIDKEDYPRSVEVALPLLRPGGLFITDNALWEGRVARGGRNPDPDTAGVMRFNPDGVRPPGPPLGHPAHPGRPGGLPEDRRPLTAGRRPGGGPPGGGPLARGRRLLRAQGLPVDFGQHRAFLLGGEEVQLGQDGRQEEGVVARAGPASQDEEHQSEHGNGLTEGGDEGQAPEGGAFPPAVRADGQGAEEGPQRSVEVLPDGPLQQHGQGQEAGGKQAGHDPQQAHRAGPVFSRQGRPGSCRRPARPPSPRACPP